MLICPPGAKKIFPEKIFQERDTHAKSPPIKPRFRLAGP